MNSRNNDFFDEIDDENIDTLLSDIITSGASRKQLYALPDNMFDALYACAHEMYQQGNISEAEQFFKFLFIYDIYNPDYAFGLAAVYQLKQEYKKALDIYAVAFALSKNNYRAMFEAGQCNLQLHYIGKAKKCFELVVEHEKDEQLVHQATLYLDAINSIRDLEERKEKKDEWYN